MSNIDLQQRDSKVLWHPFTQVKTAPFPIPIVSGKGTLLFDANGRAYIDAISSWWVNLHGHAHPAIAERIAAQARKLEQVIFAGFTHEPAIELAEKLLGILPGNQSRVFYSDDGSTAVEVALKMALQYWANQGKKRHRFIALEGGYHGDTFGCMSVGAPGAFTDPFKENLCEVDRVPVPNSENLQQVFSLIERYLIGGDIAAFIFEPLIQGAGGMRMYSAAHLSQIIDLCKQFGVPTIADEVFTGFGRTGKLFATDYCTSKPDIICLSKGITGGFMPLGVTTCSEHIYNAFIDQNRLKMFLHGHSYTANPLACAAGLASFDLLLSPECAAQIGSICSAHLSFLERIKSHPMVVNPRVLGTIIAFDLHSNEDSTYSNSLAPTLAAQFISRGILLRPLGNVLYLVPPYCITDSELSSVYTNIIEVLCS